MKVLLIESLVDELVPEQYKDTIMTSSDRVTHWETLEITEEQFRRYEELRIALYEMVEELRGAEEEEED